MTISRWRAPAFLAPILLCLLAAGLWAPLSPAFRPLPSDDPSVFLYVGQTLLDGGAPYRDAWDHKMPLAYGIYALGLALTSHSLWGLWAIELAGLLAFALLSWALLRRVASDGLAFAAVTVGLLTLTVIIWAYSLEELALPLQALTLLAFANLLRAPTRKGEAWSLPIGAATGLCFFLKPSLVGAGAAAGLYLVMRILFNRAWHLLPALAKMAAGFGLVAGLVLGYLAAFGLLEEYRDASLVFNLYYADLGPLERAAALGAALAYMRQAPGLLLALLLWVGAAAAAILQQGARIAGWLRSPWSARSLLGAGLGLAAFSLLAEFAGSQPGFGMLQWALLVSGAALAGAGGLLWKPAWRARLSDWFRRAPRLPKDDPLAGLCGLAALYLPLALLLLTLSGRSYVYYFIALVPALTLLVGVCAGLWQRSQVGQRSLRNQRAANEQAEPAPHPGGIPRLATVLALAAGVFVLAFQPLWMVIGQYRAGPNPIPEIAGYITANTLPGETILAWGKDTTYTYFLSGRRAPSRYFYQAPIVLEPYNERFGVSAHLLADLQARPPALFLIQGEAIAGGCPLAVGDAPNSPGQVFGFICQHYRYADHVGEFQVYRWVGQNP